MTALLVRERRPFRIYSEYVEQNCCAYKETQKFLAHAQHPLYKGVTNRLATSITKFDTNSNSKRTLQASFFTVQASAAGLAAYCEAKRPSLRGKPAAFRFWTADLLPAYVI